MKPRTRPGKAKNALRERVNKSDPSSNRSFEIVLEEFRAELLKLTPLQVYVTRADFVEQIIAERDLRVSYLNIDFGEPGWDMLVDLYRAGEIRQKISVSSLTLASRVPPTTALRQIAHLKSIAMIVTEPDPSDRRRAYVFLTQTARNSMDDYLNDLARRRHIALMPTEVIGEEAEKAWPLGNGHWRRVPGK